MDRLAHTVRSARLRRWYAEVKQRGEGDCIPALRGSFYVIVVDSYQAWNDNPIKVGNRVLYDSPERIPAYAKRLVRKAFDWIEVQSQRQQ